MNGLRSRNRSDHVGKGGECEEVRECEEDLVVDVGRKGLGSVGEGRKKGSCVEEPEKGLVVSGRKKDGRGRPRKSGGSKDGESDENLVVSDEGKLGGPGERDGECDEKVLVSVEGKLGGARESEGNRDGESDEKVLVSAPKKRGRPRKNEGNADRETDDNVSVKGTNEGNTDRETVDNVSVKRKNEGNTDRETDDNVSVKGKNEGNTDRETDGNVSVKRKRGRPRKNGESSDRKSDGDLVVSVVRRVGRPRKDEGVGDSVVVDKGSEEAQIGRKKAKKDDKGEKRSKLDVYEYNEDDFDECKIEGHQGVNDERKVSETVKKSSLPVKRNREDGVHDNNEIEDNQIHSAVTLKEKSKRFSKNRIIRKGETSDALVPGASKNVERSGKASDQSKEDENKSSKSAGFPIGKRTRSAVKMENDLERPESLPISEEKTSVKKNKHHRLRTIKKDTSMQLGLKGNKGRATLTAENCMETEVPKKRKVNVIKESLRDQIKTMVENAGWKIDYRPRAGRNYNDAVYIDHEGTAHWSVLRAYYALQRQYGNNKSDQKHCESSFLFTPIPEESLGILKRKRRTKEMIMEEKMKKGMPKKRNKKAKGTTGTELADKEQFKKRKGDNMNREKLNGLVKHKGKSLKMRLPKKGFKLNKKTSHRRPNSHKACNNSQNPLQKPSEANNASFRQLQARKSKTQRGYTLLVRKSDQEVNSSGDNFIAYAGRRTILSWLIDSEIVSDGEKVKYMNKTNRQALLEGFITRDGINCGCCSEIVTIREFEAHAGSKLCQPCQNVFVGSGITLFQCQIDAWNKQDESERSGYHGIDIHSDDPNDDTCGICGDGGDLICCDGCPSTFHQSCLGIQVLPKGDWHCFNCRCKFCGVVGSNGGQEGDVTTSRLLTCSLCEEKYHGSCILQTNAVPIASGVLSLFCGQQCRELSEKLQKLLGVQYELEAGFSWSLIQRSDLELKKSLCELSLKVDCNSKLALALSIMDECFLPTIDERSGINLIHNVVYNCGSNFNRLNYGGFYTFLLERGDEIISAASVRIHGTRFAEMPFIGTRYMYRRQGMCRRLLNAIELSLSYLKVEKLIIPAISELQDTWTNVFGFSPLEETFKHELKSLNMLVFPGVAMLQKLPLKHNLAEITFNVGSALNARGVEGDNHNTSEATDNTDTGAVKPDNLASYVNMAHHTNGIFEKTSIAGTGLPPRDGLVQDTSDTSNPSDVPGQHISQEQGSACYEFQSVNGSISETNSILSEAGKNLPIMNFSVKSDHRASLIDLNDVPTEVDVKADGVESDIRLLTDSVCSGSNSKFNSGSTQYIELESKPLEVFPEELHATHCEQSTHDTSDEAIKHVEVKGDATLVQGITVNVICHDSYDNMQPQKTESDSNASGAEDCFFDAADNFLVVGNKVAVTESKPESLDSDSVCCTKKEIESIGAVINGDSVAYIEPKGHDFLPNLCKPSSKILNASDTGQKTMRNVGDESLAVFSGGSDPINPHDHDPIDLPQSSLHDSSDMVVESISQVSNGIDCTSVPDYTCDAAANDTSTESKCIRNHSHVC